MSKITRIERLKETDGTYEITLVEKSRRKLTTEDELITIIATLAHEAQTSVQNTGQLLLGEKDVYLAFARRFIGYLKDDPKLFNDFLAEVNKWPSSLSERSWGACHFFACSLTPPRCKKMTLIESLATCL